MVAVVFRRACSLWNSSKIVRELKKDRREKRMTMEAQTAVSRAGHRPTVFIPISRDNNDEGERMYGN